MQVFLPLQRDSAAVTPTCRGGVYAARHSQPSAPSPHRAVVRSPDPGFRTPDPRPPTPCLPTSIRRVHVGATPCVAQPASVAMEKGRRGASPLPAHPHRPCAVCSCLLSPFCASPLYAREARVTSRAPIGTRTGHPCQAVEMDRPRRTRPRRIREYSCGPRRRCSTLGCRRSRSG
jgi:hypothetical protein